MSNPHEIIELDPKAIAANGESQPGAAVPLDEKHISNASQPGSAALVAMEADLGVPADAVSELLCGMPGRPCSHDLELSATSEARLLISAWREYTEQGLTVFPTELPYRTPKYEYDGKHPVVKWKTEWLDTGRAPFPHLASINRVRMEPGWGLWMATGQVSKRVSLDIDKPQAEAYWREKIGSEIYDRAYRVNSSVRDGFQRYHLDFRIRQDDDRPWPSHSDKTYDFRGDGGGVKMPPSVHPRDGVRYEYVGGELLDAPECLWRPKSNGTNSRPAGELKVHDGMAPIDPDADRELTKYLDQIRQLKHGECDTGFTKYAYWPARAVRGGVFPEQYVWERVEAAVSESDMEMDHAQNKWEYLLGRAEKEPLRWTPGGPVALYIQTPATSPTEQLARPHVVQGYDLTQLGNAERLRDRHGADMRHVPGWGWLTWDGRCWVTGSPQARRYMHSVVFEAKAWLVAQDEAVRQKYDSWFTDMSKSAGISAALNEAAVFEGIDAEVADFDADPYKLLVGNGVVNLRTGQLSEYHRDDRITKGTTVEYDPAAAHPRWANFLDWAFRGDDQMIDYVRRMFGMCLVGNNSHQVAFFLYGPGRSGKTTLVNILSRLLGDYATVADLSVFRESAGGHNDALARLAGRRLVTFSETRAGQQINEAVFKRMTGGDELTASYKGKTGFSFRPMFTPVMFGNAQPSILFDSGVARRMKVIPMTANITDDKKDLELENKLMSEEGPAILAWAVRGAMASWNSDPADPSQVVDAVRELRQDSDPLTQFVEDCLSLPDTSRGETFRVASDALWATYRNWVMLGGVEFTTSRPALTSRLKTWGAEHGHHFDSTKSNNVRYLTGVKLSG